MATKILRKNIKEINGEKKNLLTQDDFNQENCIYKIKYNFDLNGQQITIPNNCKLDFSEGGSLYNGTILGTNLLNEYIDVQWFMPSINYDALSAFKMAINLANSVNKRLEINNEYIINTDTDQELIIRVPIDFHNHKLTINTSSDKFLFTFNNPQYTKSLSDTAKKALLKVLNNNIYKIDDDILSEEEKRELQLLKNCYIKFQVKPSRYDDAYIETIRQSYVDQTFYYSEQLYIGAVNSIEYIKYNESLPDDVSLYYCEVYPEYMVYINNVNITFNSPANFENQSYKSIGIETIGVTCSINNVSIDGRNIKNKNYGLLNVTRCYYSNINNIKLIHNEHDVLLGSSYSLVLYECFYIHLDNIHISDFNNKYWGHTVSHFCYFITITNSVLGRIDSHYRGFNYLIQNCTLTQSCRFSGGGYLKFQNVNCYTQTILMLRNDYLSEFDGDVYFDNITFYVNKSTNYNNCYLVELSFYYLEKEFHPNKKDKKIHCINNIYATKINTNNKTLFVVNTTDPYDKGAILPDCTIDTVNATTLILYYFTTSESFFHYNNQNINGIQQMDTFIATDTTINKRCNVFATVRNANCGFNVLNSAESIINNMINYSTEYLSTIPIISVNVYNCKLQNIISFNWRNEVYLYNSYLNTLNLSSGGEGGKFTEIYIYNCRINLINTRIQKYPYYCIYNSQFVAYSDDNSEIEQKIINSFQNNFSNQVLNNILYNIRGCSISNYIENVLKNNLEDGSNISYIKYQLLNGNVIKNYNSSTDLNTLNLKIQDSSLGQIAVYKNRIPYISTTSAGKWKQVQLIDPFLSKGTTSQRPTLTSENEGFQYYDTTLHEPIWWNGTQWIDGTNTPIE